MITFQEEKIVDCLDEIKPLLEMHWEEVAINKDKIKLNPDYDKYISMEAAGCVYMVTVRDDNLLVGYFISFVVPHMHYKDHLFALNDILFLAPGYRGDYVTATGMFNAAEAQLKRVGVSVINLHMKTAVPFEALASYCGYDKIEYIYSKYIKD